jgi:predicted metal-dependent peptidase
MSELIRKFLAQIEPRPIVLAFDVSGHLPWATLGPAVSEVLTAVGDRGESPVMLVAFDAQVRFHDYVNTAYPDPGILLRPFVGGGGSDPRPVLTLAKRSNARALVIVSDELLMLDIEDPGFPFLVMDYAKEKA